VMKTKTGWEILLVSDNIETARELYDSLLEK
jgi:hypothetical protein